MLERHTATRLALVASALMLSLTTGCSENDSTQVVVLMDTDYVVPAELDRIVARVSKVSEGSIETETWSRTFMVSSEDDAATGTFALPATFAVVPAEGDVDGEIVIELEGLARDSEQVLVSRRLKTGFVQGQSRLVRLLLYRACSAVVCPTDEACGCADGQACAPPSCVAERVDPNVLEAISDPGALPPDSDFPVDPIECEPGRTACSGTCVDTSSDPIHCGGCGRFCPAGDVCEAGQCNDPNDCRTNGVGCEGFTYCDETTGDCLRGCDVDEQCGGNETCDRGLRECVCREDFESCLNRCVDTQTDPRFCGDCITSCPSGSVCDAGMCADLGDCRTNGIGCSGFTYCDEATGECLRGCEQDEQCGGSNEVCDLGVRDCVCDTGFDRCPPRTGSCVDTQTDSLYCGSCDVSCPTGDVCEAGTCTDPTDCRTNGIGCGAGLTYCDPDSGECLPGCDRDEQCTIANEVCDTANNLCACGESFERCGSACVDTQTNPAFCGDCGTACVGDEICDAGVCTDPTDCRTNGIDCAGFTYCDLDTGECLPGCDSDAQCTIDDEICDTDSNACVCAEDFERCGEQCCPTSCPPGQVLLDGVCASFHLETINGQDNVGRYTSIALDGNENPHVSYFDSTDGDLNYGIRLSGGAWALQTPDDDEDVGRYTSLAFDPSGTAHVGYYDSDQEKLLFATAEGLGTWSVETVDGEDGSNVGQYTSVAYDSLGAVHISYYDQSNRDLKYATRSGAGPWTIEVVDGQGDSDVGQYTSIAIGLLGTVHISYYDQENRNLKFATRIGPGTWSLETVDGDEDVEVGQYSSLAIDSLGVQHVAYFDLDDENLKYATRVLPGIWIDEVVDSNGDVGKHCSLAFGDDATARVSYYDESDRDLKYGVRTPNGSWDLQTLDSIGSAGTFTSIAVDSLGNAHISYFDISNSAANYALVSGPP